MPEQTALQTKSTLKTSRVAITSAVVIEEILSFFRWWYVDMPGWYVSFIRRMALLCDDTLSISILFKTFFIPWHRDYSIVGRGFGIVIRMLYLPIALSISVFVLGLISTVALLWALLPPIALVFLLRSPFL